MEHAGDSIGSGRASSMVRSQKRLTFLTNSISRANGGMFDVMRNLAIEIKKENGYSLSVIGLRDSETDRDQSLWDNHTIETVAFPVRGPHAFGYAPGLVRNLEQNDSDVLHVHGLWMYLSVAAIRWSRRSRPYVVSPHGMLDAWALNNSRWKKRISAMLYENQHLRGAACLHALNLAEADAIRDYGLRNPICVIPNGVELPQKLEPRNLQRPRTLFYLGRLHPKKGLPMLIEAWSLVQREANESGWRLVIAGWDQSGHEAELKATAAKLHAGSSVCFVGPKFGDVKAASFSAASAFILPSLSEGLPMTVLEAWSWGLPVLMTPKCNLPEGAAAEAAIMMEADSDSIAGALRRLFSMSDFERECMGMNGRHLVEEKFQWPQIARQMVDVYDWMLGLGPKPGCVLN